MEEFLYLDIEGIANLYAQLEEETKMGSSRELERSHSIEGTASGTLGLEPILKMLHLGEAKAELTAKGDRGRKATRLTEYKMMPQNQMSAVLRYLAGEHSLYRDAYEASNAAKASGRGAFCELDGIFQPHGTYSDIEDWLTAVSKAGFVTMEMRDDPSVFFGMSIAKMIGVTRKQITRNSHFGVRLGRGQLGLRVWGRMDSTKYVKPYAIAYRS
jgi:hypothetical protein